MEAKLDKIFNIFSEKNNESLFELCVRQIIEIYKDSPSSIYYLLKKAMRLLFSTTKDSYLQLKHRQVAAGIIEKTYRSYTERLQKFLHADLTAECDDIDILSLFHMEKLSSEVSSNEEAGEAMPTPPSAIIEEVEPPKKKERASKKPKAAAATTTTTKKGKKEGEAKTVAFFDYTSSSSTSSTASVKTIDDVKNRNKVKVSEIDFVYMMKHEEPLYAREKGFYDVQL